MPSVHSAIKPHNNFDSTNQIDTAESHPAVRGNNSPWMARHWWGKSSFCLLGSKTNIIVRPACVRVCSPFLGITVW